MIKLDLFTGRLIDVPESSGGGGGFDGQYSSLTGIPTTLTLLAPLSTTAFGRGFLELADQAAGRIHLALGTAAVANTGTSSGNVPVLDITGKIPTSLLPASVLGDVQFQDTWDADANDPVIPAADSTNKGHYYVVSTAGDTDIDGETDWKVGDWLVSNGTTWNKIDNTDLVTSVAGRVGAVTLTASDITDSTDVGRALLKLTNPGAVTFVRLNADNSVTARSAANFKSDLSLDLVENTALSTWAGSTNLTTLGTIGTGTWQGTSISTVYTDAKIKTVTGTTNRVSIGGTATDPTFDIAATYVGQSSITTVGTIGSGTWQGGVVAGQYGGTGVANTGKTITLGGNLTTSGAFALTLTLSATTSVTLPTSGTLATLAGAESLTNKKLGSLTTNGFVKTSGGDGTLSVDVTDYQPLDPDLTAIAALATTSFGRAFLALVDQAGGRSYLGLGTAALADTGTSSGNVPVLDGTGKIPTSLLPSSVLGDVQFQDTWNATTNTPTIPAAASGNKGWYYVVATAGSTSIDGETDWKVGDWLVSNGTSWNKIDNTDLVTSVAGRVGAVTLTASDVTDATTVGLALVTLANPSAISFIRINADNSVTTRSAANFKSDLSLNNVENTALSTWAGTANITTLGTITTGVWNGTSIGTGFTDAKIKTVTGTTNRLSIGGTSTDPTFDVSSSYVGQASITTLGTIGTGTWQGTAIATTYIANSAVTYAKIQNISATARVLGRKTSGAGVTEEVTLSELLDFVGSAAQGDILYRGASAWARLGAGTSGYFLKTLGTGANPAWAAGGGGDALSNLIAGDSSSTLTKVVNHTATETVICDVVLTDAPDGIAVISLDVKISTNNPGFMKSGTIRLRRTNTSGTVLSSIADESGVATDSSAGNVFEWRDIIIDNSPADAHYVLTYEYTGASPSTIEVWSALKSLVVQGASPGPAGLVTSITGTANEITRSAATGAVTLSLPSALTFTGKTITGGSYQTFTGTQASNGNNIFVGQRITDTSPTGNFLTFLNAGFGVLFNVDISGNLTSNGSASFTTIAGTAITSAPTIAANTGGDGIVLQNTSTASSGNQMFSPRVHWSGRGWKTNATAASQRVDAIMELRPVQGTANPTSLLAIATSINGGAYTDRWTMTDTGNVIINSSNTAAAVFEVKYNGSSALKVLQTELQYVGYGRLAWFQNNSDASDSYFAVQNTAITMSLGAQDSATAYFYTNGHFDIRAGSTQRVHVHSTGGMNIGASTDPGNTNLSVAGVYKVALTQVVKARIAGWGLPTGTLYRTALTNASTQAQFNQALMALLTDLHATAGHGLIGT